MAAPLISVVIATYNWSAALRCAIASALAQTHENVELLVIGDACTDDSAAAVESFGDSRVRWHNLEERWGSQSGPNNRGLSLAAGEFVAYLGHDDIWHPGHLRSLLERQSATGADLVCARALLYGPPGSGVLAVTGLPAGGRDDASAFYPPSSIMHRRALVDRIGPWRRPEDLPGPVDCEFLDRARQHGAQIEGTGRLTVFKFTASWRRDSYRRRDTSEQERLLARLRTDPAGVVEEALADVERAREEKRLLDVRMPDDKTGPGGVHHRANLRRRGLDDAPALPLADRRRFHLDDQISALDWHLVESSPHWGTYRWTGPSPSSVIVLPVQASGPMRVTMQVLNWLQSDVAAEVKVRVNGHAVPLTFEGDGQPALRLCGIVPGGAASGPIRIHLETAIMRCPHFLSGAADERWLGVCVNWVEVEPVSPSVAG